MKTSVKIIISLCAVVFVIAICFVILFLFNKKTNLSANELHVQIISEFSPAKTVKETSPIILPLKKIPDDFDQTFEKLSITSSREDKIKILKYGLTVVDQKKEEEMNLSTKYFNIASKNVPIILNNQAIDLYFQSNINQIRSELVDNHIKKTLKKALKLSIYRLNIEDLISILSAFPKYLSVKQELSPIIKNLPTQDISVTITQLNSLPKEDTLFIIENFKTPDFSNRMNEINKVCGILGLPQIFVDSNETALPSFNYDYLKEINGFQHKISTNNSALLTEAQIRPSISNSDFNTEIYYEKNTNQLQKYLDYVKFLKANVGESIDNTELDTLEANLNELLSARNPETLKRILNSLPTVNIPEKYSTGYEIIAVKSGKEIKLAVAPIILNPIYDVKISNNNFHTRNDERFEGQLSGTVRIPVLMYHYIDTVPKVGKASEKSMYVTPEMFEQQLAYLLANNYKTLSIQEFNNLISKGKNPAQKSVLLTFDDGKESHYTHAFPLLKKYGMKGTFFIPSQRSAVKANQLKEMADGGMSIESHTVTHPNLVNIPTYSEVAYQVGSSEAQIQHVTGKPVISLAFPGCMWDSRSLGAMGASGYSLGFSCGKSIDHYYAHRYVLSRIHVSNEMVTFKRILRGDLDW